MPAKWRNVPIDAKLFLNIDETALTRAQAAIENAFQNEAKGYTRFPGLKDFVTLPEGGRVYLHDWRGDLIAATSKGQVYRIDEGGNVENVTKVLIAGGGRVIFAKTEDELLMAAGGPIIRFAGEETEILSKDAPLSTHVGFIDSYVVALEINSGRFFHSQAGTPRKWDVLDVFSADGKPDDINSLIVTPFRELLLCGDDSIEQFERLASGETPFFRRWAVGEGIFAPGTLVFADNATWGVNRMIEFVRFSGQISSPASGDIGKVLEPVDDWTDAWVGGYPDRPLHLLGQKFLLLQLPYATNPYGTKGLTFVYDYRQQKWFALYSWDNTLDLPTRWPGWSHWPMWGRVYVGCEGKVCQFTTENYNHSGKKQRMFVRTGHLSEQGEIRIDNTRLRLRRGVGSNEVDPTISIRCNRDNKGFGRWVRKGLGKAGDRFMMPEFGGFGMGHTWQFEFQITDDAPIEIARMEVLVTQIGR